MIIFSRHLCLILKAQFWWLTYIVYEVHVDSFWQTLCRLHWRPKMKIHSFHEKWKLFDLKVSMLSLTYLLTQWHCHLLSCLGTAKNIRCWDFLVNLNCSTSVADALTKIEGPTLKVNGRHCEKLERLKMWFQNCI